MADKFCKMEWQCNCKRIKVCRRNSSCSKEWRTYHTETSIIVNSLAIKWKDGSLQVKENKNITDDTPYGGGQVLDIDIEKMIVKWL